MKRFYLTFVAVAALTIFSACSGTENNKAKAETYTMETIYDSTVDGFVSNDGNLWGYTGSFEDGETYTFLMNDNGTADKVTDDIMVCLCE